MTVLVTGATGFVGRVLLVHLSRTGGLTGRAAVRRAISETQPPGVPQIVVGEIDGQTDWSAALRGVSAVVHLAARVHIMGAHRDPDDAFTRVNVEGTLALARQALAAGARRFVYVSSVKVHGDSGHVTEDSPLVPADSYAVSKLEAERALSSLAREGLETVVVRPPLIYGAGARANFAALVRAVRLGVPLPFGRVTNRRSLIGVDNLCDFLCACVVHPQAAGQTFLVSDGEDLSTPELIRRVAAAMGRPARLVPVPPRWLAFGAGLIGRAEVAERLLGSLQLDSCRAQRMLGWAPPVSVDEGLRRAVSVQ